MCGPRIPARAGARLMRTLGRRCVELSPRHTAGCSERRKGDGMGRVLAYLAAQTLTRLHPTKLDSTVRLVCHDIDRMRKTALSICTANARQTHCFTFKTRRRRSNCSLANVHVPVEVYKAHTAHPHTHSSTHTYSGK